MNWLFVEIKRLRKASDKMQKGLYKKGFDACLKLIEKKAKEEQKKISERIKQDEDIKDFVKELDEKAKKELKDSYWREAIKEPV